MIRLLFPAVVACLLLASLSRLPASEATFSPDGRTLWLAPIYESGFLWEIDPATWKAKKMPLASLAEDESVQALCVDDKGNLLVATNQAVIRIPRDGGKPARIITVPEGDIISGISCATAGDRVPVGTIFVLAFLSDAPDNESLLALKPGAKEALPIFVRRLNDITSPPVFSASGRMAYGGNWDLWEGYLELWEEEESDQAGALGGSRFAPLGLFNTDSANSGSMGVTDVAIAGETAYAALGGRHRGALVKIPLPTNDRYAGVDGSHPELAENFTQMKAALAAAVIVEESERIDALAVRSHSGIFYRSHGENGFEWKWMEDGASPKIVGKESLE